MLFSRLIGSMITTASQGYTKQAKLAASDGVVGDLFGGSVSISADGNTAVIGANREDANNATDAGSAYVMVRSGSTWTQQAKLVASDPELSDDFGYAVAISKDGNTIVVGSPKEDPGGIIGAGSAYIFVRSGTVWTQQTKLAASDADAGDGFGYAVAINSDGNTVLVGAPYESDRRYSGRGAAYVFVRSGSTWTQQASLYATDQQQDSSFGGSVSLSDNGNIAIIGALLADSGGLVDTGAAYTYLRNGSTWYNATKIVSSDIAASDFFGASVAMSGDGTTALVGAMREDPSGISEAGSAYVFVQSGNFFVQQAKLVASDPAVSDFFGCSIALSTDGNTAVIGAYGEDPNGVSFAGSAYVFTRSGTAWSEQAKLSASDAQSGDEFGRSVSINSDGTTILAGASQQSVQGRGFAYVYTK